MEKLLGVLIRRAGSERQGEFEKHYLWSRVGQDNLIEGSINLCLFSLYLALKQWLPTQRFVLLRRGLVGGGPQRYHGVTSPPNGSP